MSVSSRKMGHPPIGSVPVFYSWYWRQFSILIMLGIVIFFSYSINPEKFFTLRQGLITLGLCALVILSFILLVKANKKKFGKNESKFIAKNTLRIILNKSLRKH